MSKAQRNREKRKKRDERERELSAIDPRLRATHAAHIPGEPRSRIPHIIAAVSPARLPDGRVVWYQVPQTAAFNLIEARKLRDRGEAMREQALTDLQPRADGAWNPADPRLVLDALADISGAVLSSFAAVESLANESIENLPPETPYTSERGETFTPAKMVRRLSIEEKLRRVIPEFYPVDPLPKGREPWQSFKRLKDIRDGLVHEKKRGYSTDADKPAVYGRLLAGEASGCVEEAYAIAQAIRPEFFPAHVHEAVVGPGPVTRGSTVP